jgi:type IV secretion system protein VirB6
MGWGYLQMMGRIEEPFIDGPQAHPHAGNGSGCGIAAVALQRRHCRHLLPRAGAAGRGRDWQLDPVGTIDAIWERGGAVADQFWQRGRWDVESLQLVGGDRGLGDHWHAVCLRDVSDRAVEHRFGATAGRSVRCSSRCCCSSVRDRLFDAWLAQLANYALISILTVLLAALLLQVLESYAAQTAARGRG